MTQTIRLPWTRCSLLCLALVGLGSVCAQVDFPPPISLPPPAARPPGQLPAEAARVKTPRWARLEAVWGATDNLHHPGVVSGAFAANGRTLVTVGQDGRLRVWDLPSRTLQTEYDACVHPADAPEWLEARSLALSAEGFVAVGFDRGRICVVDVGTGGLIRNIDAHGANVVAVAFAAGRLISYASQERIVEE
ncbi:MAG TPA: hypothetical protein VNO55_11930, partial [Polyangia bacterium]|nr:hypothetical protein [Polyangia bacterium]